MTALVSARGVGKLYRRGSGNFWALRNVNLTLEEGRVTGLVGQSGCGKSTFCRLATGAERPDEGALTLNFDRGEPWAVQCVFQNPHRSLTPTMTVLDAVTEPLTLFSKLPSRRRRDRAAGSLTELGLGEELWNRKPRQLSGGQAQRVALARSLVMTPRLLVLDEPISSLDAPAQAQTLNCIKKLWQRHGLTCLFVAHDLAAVDFLCGRIAVMYGGTVIEEGEREQVVDHPAHSYTKLLLESALGISGGAETRR